MQATTLATIFIAGLALSAATDPLTLTVGSTAYYLTASQVTIAAASIAALAITKELLILTELTRRGRRDVNSISQTPVHLEPFFDSIARNDVADCGKLLVCHSIAKTGSLNAEEKAITKLFDNLEVINPNSGYAEYQLAAYAGTFKHPELCIARYNTCRTPIQKLREIIKAN